jgi:hypothetical protein
VGKSAADVPTFSLLVYVCSRETGVRVRAANLAGFEFVAANERSALQKIVPAIKMRVTELLASDQPIPWLEPPLPITPGEQQRVIPFHL